MEDKLTDLGFTSKKQAIGTHLCIIYSTDNERDECLKKFILTGIDEKCKTSCFTDSLTYKQLKKILHNNNINLKEFKKDSVKVYSTNESYFRDGIFSPERMLNNIKNFYTETMDQGYKQSRIIGEMIPHILEVEGGSRLMEYESLVTLQLRKTPVTTICQYDSRVFPGSIIMEVLKVHPQMLVNGVIINNPFYIRPEEYLKRFE